MHEILASVIVDIMIFFGFDNRHIEVISPPLLEIKDVVRWPRVRRKVIVRLEIRQALVKKNDKAITHSHAVDQLLSKFLTCFSFCLLAHSAGHVLFLKLHQSCLVTEVHVRFCSRVQDQCVLCLGQGLLANYVQALKFYLRERCGTRRRGRIHF